MYSKLVRASLFITWASSFRKIAFPGVVPRLTSRGWPIVNTHHIFGEGTTHPRPISSLAPWAQLVARRSSQRRASALKSKARCRFELVQFPLALALEATLVPEQQLLRQGLGPGRCERACFTAPEPVSQSSIVYFLTGRPLSGSEARLRSQSGESKRPRLGAFARVPRRSLWLRSAQRNIGAEYFRPN